uniref:RxLR effector protein n=1 Tax=Phytophthora ramorum TaxID=164328 RepID=H3GMM4_PHYRM
MRISYILLVATAATLLASGNAATASGPTTGDSIMASPDLVVSLGTAQDVGGETRFLRKHKDEVSEEEDDDDEEEEERKKGPGFFDSQRLEKMLGNRIYRSKWFNRWKDGGYTPINVQNNMGNELYQKYKHWYYHGPGALRN